MRLFALSLSLALLLAQIAGCHYYVRATPTIIVSDSPITPPEPTP
jgi:hypothetical protein